MWMAGFFLVVALLYSMVGFGGGSSYIALMVLFDVPYERIPSLALVCNIIVVLGGAYHFVRRGHFRWNLLWPFMAGSVPMAFIGGRTPLSQHLFLVLLGTTLLVAGIRLLLLHRKAGVAETQAFHPGWGIMAGAFLGLLAGLVGIGGGIFLAPLMLNLRWGFPKQVAATCSVFILVNSLSGLAGQLLKHQGTADLLNFWPLFLAVVLGGQVGSRIGAGVISQKWVRSLTGLLVVFVGARVLLRWVSEF